jgi:hypothetical protein
VKVAGVPDLAAGTATCQLTVPAKVISATGKTPHFGGADVHAILHPAQPGGQGGDTGQPKPGAGDQQQGGGQVQTPPPAKKLTLKLPVKLTTKAFAKGLTIQVSGANAGKLAGSASIPAALAKKAGLTKRAKASITAAVSKAVVVARGSAQAKGDTVTLKLVPTKAAKKAAKRLRKATVTIVVSQGIASAQAKARLF